MENGNATVNESGHENVEDINLTNSNVFYSLFDGVDPPWLNNVQGDWILNDMTSSNSMFHVMPCPICSERMQLFFLPTHISQEHPVTFNLWLYMLAPTMFLSYLDPENNLDDQNDADNSLDIDNMSYEQLLQLCDTIGYHHVGYSEEEILRICEPCEPTKTVIEEHPRCPICLTEFDEMTQPYTPLAKLPCMHTFCTACIHEWLKTNKKCPVCKQCPLEN